MDVVSVRTASEEHRTEGNRTVGHVQRVQACHRVCIDTLSSYKAYESIIKSFHFRENFQGTEVHIVMEKKQRIDEH